MLPHRAQHAEAPRVPLDHRVAAHGPQLGPHPRQRARDGVDFRQFGARSWVFRLSFTFRSARRIANPNNLFMDFQGPNQHFDDYRNMMGKHLRYTAKVILGASAWLRGAVRREGLCAAVF